MNTPEAWAKLARNLKSRYPDDFAERLASYRDGSNPDLQRWRAIGGTPRQPREVRPHTPAAPGPNAVRNRRVVDAFNAGVPQELLCERFGLSHSAISAILAGAKFWVAS